MLAMTNREEDEDMSDPTNGAAEARHLDEQLDEALEESFPASDPVAQPSTSMPPALDED